VADYAAGNNIIIKYGVSTELVFIRNGIGTGLAGNGMQLEQITGFYPGLFHPRNDRSWTV